MSGPYLLNKLPEQLCPFRLTGRRLNARVCLVFPYMICYYIAMRYIGLRYKSPEVKK